MTSKKIGWLVLEKAIQTFIFWTSFIWFIIGAMWLAGKFAFGRTIPFITNNKKHNDEVIKSFKVKAKQKKIEQKIKDKQRTKEIADNDIQ